MSRPTTTVNLIERLVSQDTDAKERNALEALSKEMIKIFRDDRRISHIPEAVALAPITKDNNYTNLCRAFNNAMINGTTDDSILEPEVLEGFTIVLRCADDARKPDLELGRVMGSLQKRLKSAVEQAEAKAQYQLIVAVSSTLDAMNDIKTTGLDREALHEPFLWQLDSLRNHEELRLAQVASYAYQALLGIPNNESPYQALIRHTVNILGPAAKLAGSISTMDPSKLFEGLADLQKNLPDLISSMVSIVDGVYGMKDSVSGAVGGVKFRQQPKSWYTALRFTDMLIQARAFDNLKYFLQKVPCNDDKDFLCGLFVQLEHAWDTPDQTVRKRIKEFLAKDLIPKASKSGHGRVYEWIKQVANSLNEISWKDTVKSAPQHWHLKFWEKKKYQSTIPQSKKQEGPLLMDLLEISWESCTEARAFYADASLREFYLKNDEVLLKIERLSGDRLPMALCSINLAIVDEPTPDDESADTADKNDAPKPSQFTLSSRLKVQEPSEKSKVSLPEIFTSGEHVKSPRRILIRGRAGVGKTTLCKQIVHEFTRSPMNKEFRKWGELFDRVLWVPLRNLKLTERRQVAGYNLVKLFEHEYFSQATNRTDIAKALCGTLEDTKSNRTLFLLDGLDEVHQVLDGSMSSFLLENLLKQPNIIITTRPHVSLPELDDSVDLSLETVGFYPDQVNEYLEKVFSTDPEKVEEVKTLLQKHQLIQDLVRIPIQLDALCHTYDGGDFSKSSPNTMTALYEAIELGLWRKDAVRLEKSPQGNLLTEGAVRTYRPSRLEELVGPELDFLQHLAFTGLHNDVIDFDVSHHLDAILDQFPLFKAEAKFSEEQTLDRLSFLRTPSPLSNHRSRSYHFLHLTFQEYFAARYIVNRWKSGKDIECLELESREVQQISPVKYLQKYKYDARYDILWRFVAGLLKSRSNVKQLHDFLSTIEEQPRDLFGPVHSRLILHCLNEADPLHENKKFDTYRQQIKEAMLFECQVESTSKLASEAEFPDKVLVDALHDTDPKVQEIILRSLTNRPKLLSRNLLKIIATKLKDPVGWVRGGAASALSSHPVLPTEVLQVISPLLRDTDERFRKLGIECLRLQSILPVDLLEAIKIRLEDPDNKIRIDAATCLMGRSELPGWVLHAVSERVQDSEPKVRLLAVAILAQHPSSTPEALSALQSQLDNPEADIRTQALKGLWENRALSDDILQLVTARLKDTDDDVKLLAADVLCRQPAVSEQILETIAGWLNDDRSIIQKKTIVCLGWRSNLPYKILQALVERIDVAEQTEYLQSPVREVAIPCLGAQSALPQEMFDSIAKHLQDPLADVQYTASTTMVRQFRMNKRLAISEDVLRTIVSLLDHEERKVRRTATQFLRMRPSLPENIENAVKARLESPESSVRVAANSILCKVPELSISANKKLQNLSSLSNEEFTSLLTENPENPETFKTLFRLWLGRSFVQHITWCVDGKYLCINLSEGMWKVPLDKCQEELKDALEYRNGVQAVKYRE